MRIACIVSEYNPFHNGHKYQIDTLKKEYDAVVAIMSGNFVQRGEIALCDKWTRAHSALLNGVDLVIELPVCYSINSAERFAYGAVAIADKMGVIDALCFGSEAGEISDFVTAAELLNNEPKEVSQKISELMDKGINYPQAREKAYKGHINSELLSKPNNILGLEYVRALKKLNSKIEPKTIKRIGAGYNEIGYVGEFNSATGIRECIKNREEYKQFLPKSAYELTDKAEKFSEEALFDVLRYAVMTLGTQKLKDINDVSEGLENKIYKAVLDAKSFSEALDIIKSKRYTMSRIRRILYSVILGFKKEEKEPEYIRVLGMNCLGREILREMKEKSCLPIVVKTADFSSGMLDKDIFATDIAYLTTTKKIGMDYLTPPITVLPSTPL